MTMTNQQTHGRRWATMLAGVAVAGLILGATDARAQWEKTSTVTFDAPVMVPGHTLQAGTYVFSLMRGYRAPHTIEILNEDESKTVAIIHAVPRKRMKLDGKSALFFKNTREGEAPALKAWFQPSTRYGHEFIYSQEEARKLAEQSQMLVLANKGSGDQPDAATLVMYDGKGTSKPYAGEAEVDREWEDWSKKQMDEDSRTDTDTDAGSDSGPREP